MTALSRIRQIGLKIETTPGTYESLAAADFSRNVTNANANPTNHRYQRNTLRAALTPQKDLVGAKLLELTFEEEMPANTGSDVAEGIWYRTLQAMGMQKAELKAITVGSISGGSFAAGDTIDSGAGETGRVAFTGTIGSDVYIIYQPIAGTIDNADTISNGTATGTVTAAPVFGGWSHRPMSENGSQTPPSVTAEYNDPTYKHRLVGGAADGTLMAKWGEVPKLSTTIRGPRVIKNIDGTPLDVGLIANVTAGPTPTALLGTVGLPIKLDAWAGVLTEIQLKFNNTLTDRRTLSTAGVIAHTTGSITGGYAQTRITGRRMEIILDPETPAEATKSLMKNWNANTDMLFHAQLGTLTALGDKAIVINAHKTSIAQDSFQQSDRDGINTAPLTLICTGATNDDDEVYIDHVMIPAS